MDTPTPDSTPTIIQAAIGIGVLLYLTIIGPMYWRYRKKNRIVTMTNSPILFSYYSQDSMILPVARGKKSDHGYSVYAFTGGDINSSSLLIEVYLPFKTKLHLLGITRRKGMDQIRTDRLGSVMEKVTLEGNYDSHFSLFADKNMQSQARYIIDPKAMAFTIDFCKSHSWEIVGSEFYFVQEAIPNAEDDPTYMWEDVERFIEEIRPAVEIPLSEHEERMRRPYKFSSLQKEEEPGNIDGKVNLVCPICRGALRYTGHMYECENHDGILAHSSKIKKLRKGKITPKISSNYKHVQRSDELTCPNCNNQMQSVPFAGSRTVIDICHKCHYRWLDSGELVGLKNHHL